METNRGWNAELGGGEGGVKKTLKRKSFLERSGTDIVVYLDSLEDEEDEADDDDEDNVLPSPNPLVEDLTL